MNLYLKLLACITSTFSISSFRSTASDYVDIKLCSFVTRFEDSIMSPPDLFEY